MSKEARVMVAKEARVMVAKEAREMVAKEAMYVLVTGSALAVELTALLPGPHALNAEEQNLVSAMAAFTIVVRDEKEAKEAKAAMPARVTGIEAGILQLPCTFMW